MCLFQVPYLTAMNLSWLRRASACFLPGDGGLPGRRGGRQGTGSTSIPLDIAPFTLVGATTRSGALTGPLRDRFGFTGHMDFYEPVELLAHTGTLGADPRRPHRHRRGGRDRRPLGGTPRIANRLLRRVRDYAEVRADGYITRPIARAALRCTTWTPSDWTASTGRCSARWCAVSAAGRSVCPRWPSRSGRRPPRSRRCANLPGAGRPDRAHPPRPGHHRGRLGASRPGAAAGSGLRIHRGPRPGTAPDAGPVRLIPAARGQRLQPNGIARAPVDTPAEGPSRALRDRVDRVALVQTVLERVPEPYRSQLILHREKLRVRDGRRDHLVHQYRRGVHDKADGTGGEAPDRTASRRPDRHHRVLRAEPGVVLPDRGGRQRHHEAALFFAISALGIGVTLLPQAVSLYLFHIRVPHVGPVTQAVANFITGRSSACCWQWSSASGHSAATSSPTISRTPNCTASRADQRRWAAYSSAVMTRSRNASTSSR